MDEVLYYLKYNIAEVRDDVIEMVSGNSIDIILEEEYRAGQKNLETREEIYSAMVIYGFLSYYDGTLKIPNKELMKEFEKALRDESFGKVMDIVKNDIAFILELKKNSTPDEAIKQIKEKKYAQKFIQENEGKKILAIAICYNSKSKDHECKIEELS